MKKLQIEEIERLIEDRKAKALDLEREKLIIDNQLSEEKMLYKEGEIESLDFEWRHRAIFASRIKDIQKKTLNREVNELKVQLSRLKKEDRFVPVVSKKEKKKPRQETIERCFVDSAKEILSEIVFKAILEEAMRRAKETEEPTC